MIAVHSIRGFLDFKVRVQEPPEGAAWWDASAVWLQGFMFDIEPYISTLFLTVAGFSMMVVARGLKPGEVGRWRRRRSLTALKLAAISWVIFWTHGGVGWPYPWLAAEILYTIGLGLVATMWFVTPGKMRYPGLLLLMAFCLGFTLLAETYPDLAISRLAQGPGAHFPNLLFVPLGALLALCYFHWPGWTRNALGGLGLAVVLAYHLVVIPPVQKEFWLKHQVERNSVETVFDKPFGRSAHKRSFVTDGRLGSTYDLKWAAHQMGLRDQAPPCELRSRGFWNKKLVLVPYLCALMLLTFWLAWLPVWRRCPAILRRGLEPLFLWGRHALKIYVVHLALVGVGAVALGRPSRSPGMTLVIMLVVAGLCTALTLVVDRRRTADDRRLSRGGQDVT